MSSASERLVTEALRSGSSNASTIRAVCPFCVSAGHRTRKPNLYLRKRTGWWFCWRCHKRGRLSGYEGQIELDERSLDIPLFEPPPGWAEIGHYGSLLTYPARNYALSRGIPSRAIGEARMGISLDKPEQVGPEKPQDFRNRLVIPILGTDGQTWLGYVGRSLEKKSSLPYLYARGMARGRMLYNQRALYADTEEPLLGVEGTLDTAYLWPDSVAFLGTVNEFQIDLLTETKRPFVAVLDGDDWRRGEALAATLSHHGLRTGSVKLPPKSDVDNVPRSWLDEEIRRALQK